MSERIELDRQAIAVLLQVAIEVARKRKAEKLARRANLRSVEGKKAA